MVGVEPDLERSIPARAGNTKPTSSRRLTGSVHPRAGGEHHCDPNGDHCGFGPSPRGRGTLSSDGASRGRDRSIPARAGNTRDLRAETTPGTVHPRAGGEHGLDQPLVQLAVGPSPRGRGTHAGKAAERGSDRSIPARAGNTRPRPYASPTRPVHPRAGGERTRHRSHTGILAGPSPRGRGTPTQLRGRCCRDRSIPARAGNARRRTCSR